MIIKKKYAKEIIVEQEQPEQIEASIEVDDIQENDNIKEDIQPEITMTQDNIEQTDDDDFNLDIENIKFDSRQERREGTRRRGYRRSQDRNVITRAQKDAISIKEAAKKEGYEAGIENANKDLADLRNNFAQFFRYKEEVYEKVSGCIMDIAVEIAAKILNKEIETDKNYILPIIKGAVEEINKSENKIVLKVMPKDVDIVRDKVSEVFSDSYFEAKISVIPDAEIKEGGVKVETSNGVIDATIETQLSIIEKALKKKEES